MRSAVVVAAFVLFASSASAQVVRTGTVRDRSFDIGVGFALNGINDVNDRPLCEELAFPCTGGNSLDPGVVLSFAGNIGEYVALIFEGGLYKERWDAPAGHRPGPGPQTNTILSLGIGPRVYLPGWNERTRFFGQFLWGARMSNAVEGSNAWQPGAGLDVRLPVGVRVRFEVDYAIIRGGPPGPRSIGGTRSLIGVVLPLSR
jgi:hypothetical protein